MARPRSSVPPLEWVASGIGLLLTVGLVALLAAEALKAPSGAPPSIEVRVVEVTPVDRGYVVEFAARNRRHATAAAVEIEGELARPGGEPERSRALLDYVPGHSERRGGLFFRRDPRAHALELRALGYQEP